MFCHLWFCSYRSIQCIFFWSSPCSLQWSLLNEETYAMLEFVLTCSSNPWQFWSALGNWIIIILLAICTTRSFLPLAEARDLTPSCNLPGTGNGCITSKVTVTDGERCVQWAPLVLQTAWLPAAAGFIQNFRSEESQIYLFFFCFVLLVYCGFGDFQMMSHLPEFSHRASSILQHIPDLTPVNNEGYHGDRKMTNCITCSSVCLKKNVIVVGHQVKIF